MRLLYLKSCDEVDYHSLRGLLVAVLVKVVFFEVLLVDALRRQLEGCRVRVAVRASPLPWPAHPRLPPALMWICFVVVLILPPSW